MDSDVQTVDENDFELVCEAPPAKKKAPVTVDLTLSSSDSEEDENVLQEGLLRQRSSGSQSSRPSTADSVGTSATGYLTIQLALVRDSLNSIISN